MAFWFRTLAAFAIAALTSSAALAEPIEITVRGGAKIGVYQTTDRKMDYTLRYCGDGKQLCVELTAARGTARTKDVKKLIGTDVVKNATFVSKNTWKGSASLSGYTAYGTMVLAPGKSLTINACTMIVVCAEIYLVARR